MKKNINYFIILLFTCINFIIFNTSVNSMENKTFYDFQVESITGETLNLNKYKGKTILLVNVASNCGFTKQYNNLQQLWKTL